MKISRNALCPCGSGKKYKHCHYGKPLPDEVGGSIELERASAETKQTILKLGGLGLVVAVAAGIWKEPSTGIVVAAAWGLGQAVYMSFRNPPPPNENAGDPAALNFGRPNKDK